MKYRDQTAIERVVAGFETCETLPDNFSHADHLAVAAWYLKNLSEEEALERMRDGLIRFLTFHSVSTDKYNETITLFWLKMVRPVIADSNCDFVEAVNRVVETFTNSKLVFDYYSEERLRSAEAKSGWLEPDLKSL